MSFLNRLFGFHINMLVLDKKSPCICCHNCLVDYLEVTKYASKISILRVELDCLTVSQLVGLVNHLLFYATACGLDWKFIKY